MKEFKKRMKSRQLLLLCGLLGACCAIMLSRNFEKAPATDFMNGFAEGFQFGSIAAIFGLLAFHIVRNALFMRNPERMKKLYISETDERRLLIMQKSGSVGMNFVTYGLAVGTAAAGNFNDTVFFTLLGACLFVSSVRGFLKLYYYNKF